MDRGGLLMTTPVFFSDGSVKSAVIQILADDWPGTLRQIYFSARNRHQLTATYQAMFKAIKEMCGDGIVIKHQDKTYQLNIDWLLGMQQNIDMLVERYRKGGDQAHEWLADLRVQRFVEKLGPSIFEAISDKPFAILAMSGSGTVFGMALKQWLITRGKYVDYFEVDRNKPVFPPKQSIEERGILVIDSAIYSGTACKKILRALNKLKVSYKLKDVKYAVECDMQGIADWACMKAKA
jgi:hypothetical protein